MNHLVMVIDERPNAWWILADLCRAIRAIVDDVFGWGHDGGLHLAPRRRSARRNGGAMVAARIYRFEDYWLPKRATPKSGRDIRKFIAKRAALSVLLISGRLLSEQGASGILNGRDEPENPTEIIDG
ncbi:MAG: hypothetical protein JWM91_584 [Rhodospirillales bacterium]|nr:hypothetical protein [Rhodospirillales bacterium]